MGPDISLVQNTFSIFKVQLLFIIYLSYLQINTDKCIYLFTDLSPGQDNNHIIEEANKIKGF